VSPFTAAALAAVAPLGGSGGGVLAVMTASGLEVAATAALLARVPPGAVLGLVVNGVAESAIDASRHHLGRHLGVPVLARLPFVANQQGAGFVAHVIGQLAELLVNGNGVTAAWGALWAAIDRSAQHVEGLVALLDAELGRLAADPGAELDGEFDLGLELLAGTDVYVRLAERRAEVLAMRRDHVGDSPATPPPAPKTAMSVQERLNRLAPWATRPGDRPGHP
jgi:hypothetical protein